MTLETLEGGTACARPAGSRAARAGEAIIRVNLTTICGTDLHIVRGEYPVEPGRIIGHEPVGVRLAARKIQARPISRSDVWLRVMRAAPTHAGRRGPDRRRG
jgi:threonine dehydrogenase-like Zn-dependent dehydrogenase